jgi:transposase InsO family protein
MLDSGATHHITPHRSDFSSYTPAKGSVCLGDKSAQDQIGVGSVIIKSPQGCTITLSNVLHVLGVQMHFISIGVLTGKGAKVQFLKDGFKITLNGRMIAIGYLEGRLYWLNSSSISINSHIKSAPTLHTWHQRMGHMSHVPLKNHGPKAVTGLDLDASTMAIPNTCHGCEAGKLTRKPFPGSAKTTSRILEVVHSDLAGPMQVKSIQGSLYTATFIDNYSHHTVVYCLKSKDQFVKALQKFLSWAETQTSEKLRALHSDRGGEYMAASVKDILNQRGIEHHLTMPGTPQQNGKAEWFNCTIMDKAMTMLYNAGLSNGFWELAISSAVHIYNHTPIRSLKWHTSHEAWNAGHVPDVSYF